MPDLATSLSSCHPERSEGPASETTPHLSSRPNPEQAKRHEAAGERPLSSPARTLNEASFTPNPERSRRELERAALWLFAAATLLVLTATIATAQSVKLTEDKSHRRVDITVDGKPFTSYLWPDLSDPKALKKPVLYPLIDSDGVTVTRGYPLQPRPNERVDHPHHAGLWFNYGNANGFDFWNNSDAIPAANAEKMGTVIPDEIVSAKSGKKGDLIATSHWTTGKGTRILDETAHYVFSANKGVRTIDLLITLKALEDVTFNDDKEGLLGMRVASWLESPEEKSGTFMDANGVPTNTKAASPDATGVYLTSEGIEGPKVWATRGRWCILSGHNPANHTDTIAVIDNPKNPGYPTYWHARGYGLFAANPLGRSIFDPKQQPFKLSIAKGNSITFRYRIEIFDHTVDAATMNHEADAFAAEYK